VLREVQVALLLTERERLALLGAPLVEGHHVHSQNARVESAGRLDVPYGEHKLVDSLNVHGANSIVSDVAHTIAQPRLASEQAASGSIS
jgi:hypothetical protein